MNILCGLDDGYTQHCAVMLTSLFINTPDANIAVYVMHQGLSSQSLKRLARVCSRFGHSFEPLLVDHGSLSRVPILEHAKVTSYLRLLVGHFLPEDLDRVLYLDSDLIVRSDLTPFYTQALGDDWVAAVADSPGPGQNERLGMSTSVRYFNTEVLLMNLPVWRAEQIGEQALRFAVEHADVIKWADQCTLNAVCNGSAKQRYVRRGGTRASGFILALLLSNLASSRMNWSRSRLTLSLHITQAAISRGAVRLLILLHMSIISI